MGTEIERKFLVAPYDLDRLVDQYDPEGVRIVQGILHSSPWVRIRLAGNAAFLTIKAATGNLAVRKEWEYDIPYEDGKELLELCRDKLAKWRYYLPFGSLTWEIDQFESFPDLVLAEIELPSEDFDLKLPWWISQEVTQDPKYTSAWIAANGNPRNS